MRWSPAPARRRRRRLPRFVWFVVLPVVLAGGIWWYWSRTATSPGKLLDGVPLLAHRPNSDTPPAADAARTGAAAPHGLNEDLKPRLSHASPKAATTFRFPTEPARTAAAAETEPVPPNAAPPSAQSLRQDPQSGAPADAGPEVAAARKQIDSGDLLGARRALNRLANEARLPAGQAAAVRTLLGQLADRMIFGREATAGDPLVETYVVRPGDVPVKIAKQFDVPAEIILRVNDIRDARYIQVGQKLRIPRGPFHARIDVSDFRLDLYLQDTLVKSFSVGLGRDQGTPIGEWLVKNRLKNPTYYPPASAADKRIINGNDPSNPLGEYWVGLEGVSGEASGRTGYGIHGTIEPDSIGKAQSLGCVRMRADDIAFVYSVMQPGASRVVTAP